MCGIAAYKGRGNAAAIAIDSLKALEYRGYDSWGICLKNKSRLKIIKQVGMISMVDSGIFAGSNSGIAIAHTRWATHGKVSKENAHPHVSCNAEIAVVHNGIIENYNELRSMLEMQGHKFASETDTEVAAHLIEEAMKSGASFSAAVEASTRQLQGSFALAIMHSSSNELVGVRKNSPLLLGLDGSNGFFLASDANAFLQHTNKAVFLDNNEMVVVGSKPRFSNFLTGKAVEKTAVELPWKASAAVLDESMPHFMLKEILEQPVSFTAALQQRRETFESIAKRIASGNVYFIACGTSLHAALLAKSMLFKISGKSAVAINASEFHYSHGEMPTGSTAVFISQSGETADVLHALKFARMRNAYCVAVVNVFGSSLARECDDAIYLNAGPEIGVASTKAFTSQVAVLCLLSYAAAGKFESGRQELMKIAGKINDTIELNSEIVKQIAKTISNHSDVYFIARSSSLAIAAEGALKLKEISYLHAEAMPAGELKHGTLALIEEKTPVIVINPSDESYTDTMNNAEEAKARGAFLIGVSDRSSDCYDVHIKLPRCENSLLYSILATVPLQLLAYHTAVLLGRNPDKPRNLAKSVTVR